MINNLLKNIIENLNNISKNTLLNFLMGILIFCFSLLVFSLILPKEKPLEFFSFIVVFIISILKETCIDKKIIKEDISAKDIITTIFGGLFVLIMSILIY